MGHSVLRSNTASQPARVLLKLYKLKKTRMEVQGVRGGFPNKKVLIPCSVSRLQSIFISGKGSWIPRKIKGE